MTSKPNLYKTKPNLISIVAVFIGGLFFSFWAISMYTSKWIVTGVSEKTGNVIIITVITLFALFSIFCFYITLGFKVFLVTPTELIYKRPLFFYRKRWKLSDIEKLTKAPEEINFIRGASIINIYKGNAIIIKFIDGQKIKLSPIEIWRCSVLLKKINSQLAIVKIRAT